MRQLVANWNRGDVDAFMALCHSDVELSFPADRPEPGPFSGSAQVREWIQGFLAAWKDQRVEAAELVDSCGHVIASMHWSGSGVGSGIDVDFRDEHVYAFREGKVLRWQVFDTRAEALEATGAELPSGSA